MTQAARMYRRSELEAVGDGCLHRYKAIWIDGVDDTSDLALVGIGLHRVQYVYIQRLVAAGLRQDVEEAQAAFTEGIALSQTPNRLIPEMRLLWDRHAEHWDLPIDQFLTAEERHNEAGSVSWSPDLVLARPNELEIVDFKWGWSPPLTEEDLRVLFQARVYSFYAQQRWPNFQSYRFTIFAARFNKYISTVFSHEDLDNVERELAAHIATLEEAQATGQWPAVAGPACRFCQLKCPLVDTPVTMPKRFLAASQAEQIGGWILAGQQMIKEAKKALKGWVSVNGPVSVNGVIWDNRPTMERKYPVQAILDVLNKRGVMGAFEEEGLTISHSALKGLFKRFPAIEEDLAGVMREKQSWRFSAKRGGDEFTEDEA